MNGQPSVDLLKVKIVAVVGDDNIGIGDEGRDSDGVDPIACDHVVGDAGDLDRRIAAELRLVETVDASAETDRGEDGWIPDAAAED